LRFLDELRRCLLDVGLVVQFRAVVGDGLFLVEAEPTEPSLLGLHIHCLTHAADKELLTLECQRDRSAHGNPVSRHVDGFQARQRLAVAAACIDQFQRR
jgi:hypothetical protein